jgi:hypothetical protein
MWKEFKIFGLALVTAFVLSSLTPNAASAKTWAGEHFTEVVYICGTTLGTGKATGQDPSNCLPFADQDLMTIEAGTVIEKIYTVITVAITGTTNFDVGDDDDADGYVDSSLSVTLGTPGMYGWDAKFAGAYQRIQTAGATDAADIYVVPNAKYYEAAGKEVKLDITTANTAGAVQVVIEGYKRK